MPAQTQVRTQQQQNEQQQRQQQAALLEQQRQEQAKRRNNQMQMLLGVETQAGTAQGPTSSPAPAPDNDATDFNARWGGGGSESDGGREGGVVKHAYPSLTSAQKMCLQAKMHNAGVRSRPINIVISLII